MPVRIKTDLEIGQVMYLKDDPKQNEYRLSAVIVRSGNAVSFELSRLGDIIEVFDFEASPEMDKLKQIESGKDDDDD